MATEVFHSLKIPQRGRNSNGTGLQRVSNANPLKFGVAPVVDQLFQLLFTVVDPMVIVVAATVFINLVRLGLNLLNYNGFATGDPL